MIYQKGILIKGILIGVGKGIEMKKYFIVCIKIILKLGP
jgi:hypothetical protein